MTVLSKLFRVLVNDCDPALYSDDCKYEEPPFELLVTEVKPFWSATTTNSEKAALMMSLMLFASSKFSVGTARCLFNVA